MTSTINGTEVPELAEARRAVVVATHVMRGSTCPQEAVGENAEEVHCEVGRDS